MDRGVWQALAGHIKNQPTIQELQEMQVQSLDWEDPLEEGMATPSSILARKIPWTEEPDRLQSMGAQRVGHDLVTELTYLDIWLLINCT